jgi:hypothetical protein
MTRKPYGTRPLDTERLVGKGALSPALVGFAGELTTIVSAIHRDCEETGQKLVNIEFKWVVDPKDPSTGKMLVIATRDEPQEPSRILLP